MSTILLCLGLIAGAMALGWLISYCPAPTVTYRKRQEPVDVPPVRESWPFTTPRGVQANVVGIEEFRRRA